MSDKKICSLTIFDCYISERDRTMLFPDSFFFAERRLVNHTIDEKRVKNLDDCELFCYLTDDCVSLKYKKDPENDSMYGVQVVMTLTAPACGMGPILIEEVKRKVMQIEEVKKVDVELVFEPPWSQDMMTTAARLSLGML